MEGDVEGTVLDDERIITGLSHAPGYAIPVERSIAERAEYQDIYAALKEVRLAGCHGHPPRSVSGESALAVLWMSSLVEHLSTSRRSVAPGCDWRSLRETLPVTKLRLTHAGPSSLISLLGEPAVRSDSKLVLSRAGWCDPRGLGILIEREFFNQVAWESPNRRTEGIVRVFLFPDTNIFLHFQFFDEVDWPVHLGAGEVTLVLTQAVFGELDEKKWSCTRREKSRAQKVLKRLDALALSTTAVGVRQAVSVMALDSEPGDELFAKHRLSPQVIDDRLVAAALEFKDAVSDRVVILSDDTGLRIKAKGRRLDQHRVPLLMAEPGQVSEQPSIAVQELQAADLAAGYARRLYESADGLKKVCLEFRQVILNGSVVRDWKPAW